VFLIAALAGCATESHRAVTPEKTASAGTAYSGPKGTITIAKFDNRSSYMRGLFSDGVDRLGGQAKTILIGHLQDTGRFNVVERENMDELAREAKLKGQAQSLRGADYAITGDVVEFGRKETGDQALFGILGQGKQQVAYSKVTLNVVDVLTSNVVYSVQGAGEYALSNREVIGFGGTAGYDSTLNGKVLDLAVREAVNRLVEGIEQGKWKPGS
jgi:curli biogenesis system outer membrane secretion channel CsgG